MARRKFERYVIHFCPHCDRCFIAEDYTRAKDRPPKWRLCPDCCKELSIDYEKQRPNKKMSEKQKKHLDNLINDRVNRAKSKGE